MVGQHRPGGPQAISRLAGASPDRPGGRRRGRASTAPRCGRRPARRPPPRGSAAATPSSAVTSSSSSSRSAPWASPGPPGPAGAGLRTARGAGGRQDRRSPAPPWPDPPPRGRSGRAAHRAPAGVARHRDRLPHGDRQRPVDVGGLQHGATAARVRRAGTSRRPDRGGSRPAIARSRVDLPDPLGPMSATDVPAGMSKVLGANAEPVPVGEDQLFGGNGGRRRHV